MKPRYSFSSRRTRHKEKIQKQRAKYPEIANQIIKDSDIILEVLDARFVEETRNLELEKQIKEKNKIIIYVLNKSDLTQKNKLKNKIFPFANVSCTQRAGIKNLRNLIKKESKKIEKKQGKITVGVIGYPNVGKSSLINILIGKSSAGVGKEAGFTKGFQKLRLTSEIHLIDSPGIIPEEEYSQIEQKAISKHTKVGGRSFSQVKNPEIVIADLMKEFKNVLEKFYKINSKGDSEILIEKLGRKKNFLKKGNEVDSDKTSRLILKDWQEGKIKIL